MGEDKASKLLAGLSAVDRCAQLAKAVGADLIYTSGRRSYGYPFIADEIDLGGPVGGIVAGVAALSARGADRAIVLAVDAPTIAPADVSPLLACENGAAYEGFHFPFTVKMANFPEDVRGDWPVARLIRRLGVLRLRCPAEIEARIRGANTPEEHNALSQAYTKEV